MTAFSALVSLNGNLYQHANGLRGSVSSEESRIEESFGSDVFGACSYLLKGKRPADPEARVARMAEGLPLFQKLYSHARYEWSPGERYISFVIAMHAWVRIGLAEDEDDIRTIPIDLADFEATDLRVVSYIMCDLERRMASIDGEFVKVFSYCQDVVCRGLAGDVVPSEFADARAGFEGLGTHLDNLWSDELPTVALRGYLAGIGLCLSWLETRPRLQ